MNRLRATSLIVLLGLVVHGCVDPFPVPTTDASPILVVDALITDEEGPHTVELTLSSGLTNDIVNRVYVGGATVRIIDNTNDTLTLNEVSTGRYQTFPASWRPVADRQYHVRVRLRDGSEYISDVQQLQPPGEIDDIYVEYKPNSINQNDPTQPQDALWVYINAQGVTGSPNLFRWRWKGIYEVLTYPELRMVDMGNGPVPDPPACAAEPCTCCRCWITEFDTQARVSSSESVNDVEFKGILITKIPVDPFRFYSKYYIEIEQLSLPTSAHDFWRLVQTQQAGATDLFQPNVIRIEGNVRSVNDANQKVYGLVSFSSVARKSLFIFRGDVPASIPPIPVVTDDCRLLNRFSSNVTPPFW